MKELIDLAWPQVADSLTADSVIVLPTGAIEGHGPHLPLATDFYVAQAVAGAAVDQASVDTDVWILPALAYTKSDEHHWAPGTMWLSWDTLMRVIKDIGRSVASTPARRLAFFNGHGGNSALLQVAARELRREYGLRTFVMHASLPADHGGESAAGELGMGVHAGHGETSIMMHVRPDLVDMSLAQRNVPEHLSHFSHVGFGRPVSFGWISNDFGPSGVIGDPTGASADYGKIAFEESVDFAAQALREVAVFTP